MIQVRNNVFETNSSSTHSICIAKEVQPTFPKSIKFNFGEFGWENDTLSTIYEKASYLYTGLFANKRTEDFKNICEILRNKGIEVRVEEPEYETRGDWTFCKNEGYIDHSSDLSDFLNKVCENKTQLFSYLFSGLSFVITGNDNDEHDVEIDVDYPHYEYYKGN